MLKKVNYDVSVAKKETDIKTKGPKRSIRKHWKIRSKDGARWRFFPTFEYHKETDFVDCEWIDMQVENNDGSVQKYTFHFMELYLFLYYCSNEAYKQVLEMKHERNVKYIPYELDFKLSKDEIKKGSATRKVELPLDEVKWFLAKQEAMKLIEKHGAEKVMEMSYNK